MNALTVQSKFSRDLLLIFFGALISFVTSFITGISNERSILRRDLNIKKYSVADQIAKDINYRLFISLELKANMKDGKPDPTTFAKYVASKEKWNVESLLYEVQINKYFGSEARKTFRTKIQSNAVYIGNDAQNNNISFAQLRKTYLMDTDLAFDFTNSLYSQIKDE
jgi:hypothetical protein